MAVNIFTEGHRNLGPTPEIGRFNDAEPPRDGALWASSRVGVTRNDPSTNAHLGMEDDVSLGHLACFIPGHPELAYQGDDPAVAAPAEPGDRSRRWQLAKGCAHIHPSLAVPDWHGPRGERKGELCALVEVSAPDGAEPSSLGEGPARYGPKERFDRLEGRRESWSVGCCAPIG